MLTRSEPEKEHGLGRHADTVSLEDNETLAKVRVLKGVSQVLD